MDDATVDGGVSSDDAAQEDAADAGLHAFAPADAGDAGDASAVVADAGDADSAVGPADADDGGGSASDGGADANDDAGDAQVVDASTDAAPASDAGDAGTGDAGDAGAPTTASLIDALGPGCLECAISQGCYDHDISSCEMFAGTKATAGPAAGTPRDQLCVATLQCLIANPCSATSSRACYCGDVGNSACWKAPGGDGPCKQIEESAFESTDPASLNLNWSDTTIAGAEADWVIDCLTLRPLGGTAACPMCSLPH